MGEPEKKMKKETKKEEKEDTGLVSEELIKWMTEGTDPNLAPRSDCG